MKKLLTTVVMAGLLLSFTGTARAGAVLFVTNDAAAPGGADTNVMNYLTGLGHVVTAVSANASSAADAVGQDLVIVSSTVNSGDVNTKFSDQDLDFRKLYIPTINWEQALTDDFRFSNDGDTVGSVDTITITADGAAHPMFAGLGFVADQAIKVYNALDNMSTADMHADESPAPGATILGIPQGDTRPHGAIVLVEGGGELNNGSPASARRINFFYDDDSFDKSFDALDPTLRGRDLFDAAVNYALTLPYANTFTWQAAVAGNWTEGAKWDPDAAAGLPDGTSRVLIDKAGSAVTASADASAFSLEMAAGTQLWIGGGTTFEAVRDLQAGSAGAFVIATGANAELRTGWGVSEIDAVLTDFAGAGTFTVNTLGLATIHIWSEESLGDTRTVRKTGSGSLLLDNTVSGSVVADHTSWRLEGGTLSSAGADPLGGAPAVEFAGGNLEFRGIFNTVYQEGFEVDGDGVTYDATGKGADSPTMFWERSSVPPAGILSGQEGANWWGGADIDSLSTAAGDIAYLDTKPIDVSSIPAPVLQVLLAGSEGSTETADFLRIWADTDYDGNPANFNTDQAIAYLEGGHGGRYEFQGGPYAGTRLGHTFQEFALDLPATATPLGLRFHFFCTGGDEELGFDAIRVGGFPKLVLGTDFTVEQDGTFTVIGNPIDLGSLDLQQGILEITGTTPLVKFTGGTQISLANTVGVKLEAPVDLGTVNGNSLAFTFVKDGSLDLTFETPNTTFDNGTFEARGGRLAIVDPASSVGTANLAVNGGELGFSSSGGDLTVANAIAVPGDGILSAGQYGSTGAAGAPGTPITVTLDNLGSVDGDLTLQTSNDYALRISDPLAGPGSLVIAGDVVAEKPISVPALTLAGGSLPRTAGADGDVSTDVLTLDGPNLDTTGSTLTVTGAINANAGTLTFDNAVSTADVNVSGGAVNADGELTATNLNVSAGALSASANAAAVDVAVSGGGVNLTDGSTLTADTMEVQSGATVNTGTGSVVVRELTLGRHGFVTDLGALTAEGSDLLAGVDITVTEPGSTLSITGVMGAGPPDAVGAWTFDNVSGDTVFDDGVDPAPANGTLQSWDGASASVGGPTIVSGKVGDAVKLVVAVDSDHDGQGQYVDLGNPPKLDFMDGNFTLSAWVKVAPGAVTGNAPSIFSKGGNWDSSAHPGIRWFMGMGESGDNEELSLSLDDDSTKVNNNAGPHLDDDVWHHVVAVRDGSQVRLYVDNTEYIGGNTLPASYTLDTSEFSAYIGAIDDADRDPLPHPARFFNGAVDEVYAFNKALSAAEVADLWNGGDGAVFVSGLLRAPNASVIVSANATVDLEGNAAELGGLRVTGGATATLSGAPDVAVGTLSGEGTVVGNLMAERLAPGGSVGTLNVTGSLGLVDGGTYEWEIGAGAGPPTFAADLANVTGELALPGGVGEQWTLTLLDAGAPLDTLSAPPVVATFGTLAGDSLGNYVIDASNVDHWIFSGDPALEVSGNQILLQNLVEIVALQWKTDGDGLWADPANWFGEKVPNGVGKVANFLGMISSPRTVTVDGDVTIGTINFGNANKYTLAGTSTITLEASGDAQINVLQGDHEISAPLSLAGGLTVDTQAAAGLTLTQSGIVGGSWTKAGGGSLTIGDGVIFTGDLNHTEGLLSVGPDVLAVRGGTVNLGGTATLQASGTVNRHVLGGSSTTLEAVGALDVGVLGDSDGYDFQGHLEVGSSMVGLKDADNAQVYETHLGGGSLSSFNGIGLQAVDVFGTLGTHEGWLTGHGTVKGAVRFEVEGANFAAIAGDGPGQEIVLDGVVSGSGWLEWVIMTGLHRPGASAGFTGLGQGTNIGPGATVMGIDGTAGFATPNPAENAARGYDQWFAMFGQHAISGDLTIALEAPTPGGEIHVPDPSMRYEIFKSFAPQGNPAFAGWYIGWFNNVTLDPSWPNPTEWVWEFDYQDGGLGHGTEPDPGRAFYSATLMVIPEPGTLVLLAMGGLGLLLVLARRRLRTRA